MPSIKILLGIPIAMYVIRGYYNENIYRPTTYGRCYVVFTFRFFYDSMDVDDNMVEICAWCNIEREELYMGGGLYVYKCPKCNSRMEYKKQ